MNRQDRHIENLFRTFFEQFRVNPSPGLWKRVRARMTWKQFLSFSLNAFNIYYLALLLAGAATFLILPLKDRPEISLPNETAPPLDTVLAVLLTPPEISGEGHGESTLKVLGKDGLEYNRQQKFRVFKTPKALFEFDGDLKPAANQRIYFYHYTPYGDYYACDVGDNQQSSLQEPIHIYPSRSG